MALTTPRSLYFEEFVVGEKAISSTRTVTEADIVMFASLTGDFNEIHTSAEFAKGSLFGQRVAHGMLGLSFAVGLAVQMGFMRTTVEAFRSVEWEFTAPIFIGDTLHIEFEVAEAKAFPRLGNGKVTIKVNLKKQDGSMVQRGAWTLLVKGKPKAT